VEFKINKKGRMKRIHKETGGGGAGREIGDTQIHS
jgi:hypothetical protein